MPVLNSKLFVSFVTIWWVLACSGPSKGVLEISVSQVPIDSTIQPSDSMLNFILPYQKHVNEVLDAPLSFAPEQLSKKDGALNSSLGNLLADLVLQQANNLNRRKKGIGVDLALLNHGGIRNIISAGPVSERTAYEVMPFENSIVIVPLTGKGLQDLIDYLVQNSVPHPISGLQLVLNPDGTLKSAEIQGKSIDFQKKYQVATSNYLAGGGDGMNFFKSGETLYETGYLIRNALTDYFKRTDTLRAKPDDRFYKITKS